MWCNRGQGGHKPGIPGEFCKPGKLTEFSRYFVQPQEIIVTCKIVSLRTVFRVHRCSKNVCCPGTLLREFTVFCQIIIIAITFWCSKLWRSKFMALEKPENPGNFFLLFCGHSGGSQVVTVCGLQLRLGPPSMCMYDLL